MRSWTRIVLGVVVGGTALVGVPRTVKAQQAQVKASAPADTGKVRAAAAADTGRVRRAAIDSTARRTPAVPRTLDAHKSVAPDSSIPASAAVPDPANAHKPVAADSAVPLNAAVPDTVNADRAVAADSTPSYPATVPDTGNVRKPEAAATTLIKAAVDTGTARRAAPDSGLVGAEERGLVKRANPLGQFTKSQTEHSRVLAARIEKRFEIKKLYRERGIEYPASEMFVRIFKRERELELWVRPENAEQFSLLKTYPICALAGVLGPKRTEGDGQTPEGFYFIDDFNPTSDFHLSLHLDYPNRADRALWKSPNPGGQIYIHGGCNSIGCLAVTDDAIKEIYWMAVEARSVGQRRIPVHIFPARLTDNALAQLVQFYENEPELTRFWSNLKTGFDYFEEKRTIPSFSVDTGGRYALKNQMLGVPVAGEKPRGGMLGQPLAGDSAKNSTAMADSARAPLLIRPMRSDSTRRGGD